MNVTDLHSECKFTSLVSCGIRNSLFLVIVEVKDTEECKMNANFMEIVEVKIITRKFQRVI